MRQKGARFAQTRKSKKPKALRRVCCCQAAENSRLGHAVTPEDARRMIRCAISFAQGISGNSSVFCEGDLTRSLLMFRNAPSAVARGASFETKIFARRYQAFSNSYKKEKCALATFGSRINGQVQAITYGHWTSRISRKGCQTPSVAFDATSGSQQVILNTVRWKKVRTGSPG